MSKETIIQRAAALTMLVGLSACSSALSPAIKERAFPRPPAELMAPARQPEPVPDNASLDQALEVLIRNAGSAKQNADQLDGLEADVSAMAGVK